MINIKELLRPTPEKILALGLFCLGAAALGPIADVGGVTGQVKEFADAVILPGALASGFLMISAGVASGVEHITQAVNRKYRRRNL
ncbi:MAG TPA: hypothetical protein VN711_04770 [Candidatus Saccharimonadales bacterium]|nr:hypothetical protein [Candidatus Saccharimonadales bacterium]